MEVTCAWCGTLLRRVPDGNPSPGPRTSHGICTACATTLLEELGIPVGHFLSSLDVPVILVSDDVEVLDASPGALAMLGKARETVLGRLGGEVFECANAHLPGGCGRTVHCSGCTLRQTVTSTWETGLPQVRVPATLEVTPNGGPERIDLLVTTARVGDRVVLRIESPDRRSGGNAADRPGSCP